MTLENKMAFYFKNTKKDIIMTEEGEEDYRKKTVDFVEKNIKSNKVRDHCHLTGKYTGAAQNTCYFNVTQNQSNFVPFIFHSFGNYDFHFFWKFGC